MNEALISALAEIVAKESSFAWHCGAANSPGSCSAAEARLWIEAAVREHGELTTTTTAMCGVCGEMSHANGWCCNCGTV